jgi:hypothetical protein
MKRDEPKPDEPKPDELKPVNAAGKPTCGAASFLYHTLYDRGKMLLVRGFDGF